MAIGWLALLKGVPWAGVISTAPMVVDGAKQLWKAVSKNPPLPEPARPHSPHAPGASAIEVLETRVFALEAETDDLHAQMIKSSELIKVLADQNAQLIKHVEAQRVRMQWLTGAGLVMVVLVLALALTR